MIALFAPVGSPRRQTAALLCGPFKPGCRIMTPRAGMYVGGGPGLDGQVLIGGLCTGTAL